MIVCTHSHADHSPGARPLQALCRDARRPSWACPRRPRRAPASEFTPDRALADGELLSLSRRRRARTRLQVIHTPGHAANHLCLVLLEDGLLFSGDHILNGSTTVVDPPDGDMTAYLDSLDRAGRRLRRARHRVHPAGARPRAGLRASRRSRMLKAHRLQREARVVAAMRQRPARHAGRLGGAGLRRRAAAHVAGGQALAAGARAAHRGAATGRLSPRPVHWPRVSWEGSHSDGQRHAAGKARHRRLPAGVLRQRRRVLPRLDRQRAADGRHLRLLHARSPAGAPRSTSTATPWWPTARWSSPRSRSKMVVGFLLLVVLYVRLQGRGRDRAGHDGRP